MRRAIPTTLALVLLALAATLAAGPGGSSGPAAATAAAGNQPNIVLILTDDQRADSTSHMPNLKALIADQGVTFSNSFVVNPLCCPARATILTGKTSGYTDIWTNGPPHGGWQTFNADGEENSTIATWLHGVGYRTSLVGKYLNHYGEGTQPRLTPPGWDDWHALVLAKGGTDGEGKGGYYDYTTVDNGVSVNHGFAESDYSTTVLGQDAVDFIDTTPTDQPLFLYFAPRAPHQPTTPEAKYANACPDVAGVPRNPDFLTVTPGQPSYITSISMPKARWVASQDALYKRSCQTLLSVDDQIGRVVDALAQTGRLSNTLILVASDNGLLMGEHRWHGKLVPYEDSIKVPLFVRYDPLTSLEAGTTDTHMVQNLDYASTFAAAAGAPAPGAMGDNLLRLLSGDSIGWRSQLMIEHWEHGKPVPSYCGVRTPTSLYVQYATGEQELYDLTADPYELNNLAGDAADAQTVATMHADSMNQCNPRPPGWPVTIQ